MRNGTTYFTRSPSTYLLDNMPGRVKNGIRLPNIFESNEKKLPSDSDMYSLTDNRLISFF